jgi:hypothetical protein
VPQAAIQRRKEPAGEIPKRIVPAGTSWPAWRARLALAVATPLIYAMLIPLVILDVFAEGYQRSVFPLLGLTPVSRRQYIRMDRHRLGYLSPMQKAGCAYCAYANGLLHLASRIAAVTERRFCPIQHKPGDRFHAPPHHVTFAPYGDRKGFLARMAKWRAE